MGTKYLPPNSSLRALFAPRPPLEFLPPIVQKKSPAYTGIADYISRFEPSPSPEETQSEPIEIMTHAERRSKKRKRMAEDNEESIKKKMKLWDPNSNPKATEEAYNTLFISKLNYETTEETLRREFEKIAPIKSAKLVYDLQGKSRGYAFIELENEHSTRLVYSKMKGREIDGRVIFIDVERGRTVKDWKPRRFGNASETTRPPKPKKSSLKSLPPSSSSSSMDSHDRRDDRRGSYGGGGGGYGGGRRDGPRSDHHRGGGDRDRYNDRSSRGGDRDYRGGDRYDRNGGDRRR